jgi:hypothetical protein
MRRDYWIDRWRFSLSVPVCLIVGVWAISTGKAAVGLVALAYSLIAGVVLALQRPRRR